MVACRSSSFPTLVRPVSQFNLGFRGFCLEYINEDLSITSTINVQIPALLPLVQAAQIAPNLPRCFAGPLILSIALVLPKYLFGPICTILAYPRSLIGLEPIFRSIPHAGEFW